MVRVGPRGPSRGSLPRIGFTLDLNEHWGAPNRLYLWGLKRDYTIGLVSWHKQVETGVVEERIVLGKVREVRHLKTVRVWPYLTRSQAWDWQQSEWTLPPRWRWFSVAPHDHRERWAKAHPEEAKKAEERWARYKEHSRVLEDGTTVFNLSAIEAEEET